MEIVRWVPGDDAGMRACCEVTLAAFAADDPDGLPMPARELRALLEHPNEPAQTWYVPGDRPGSAKAIYHMRLPDRLSVDPEFPEWGHQLLTAVSRPHRGHRLGLLVKAEMLSRLTQAEPGIERIVTGNAAANRHMIAINEALGYELLDPQVQNYEIQVGG